MVAALGPEATPATKPEVRPCLTALPQSTLGVQVGFKAQHSCYVSRARNQGPVLYAPCDLPELKSLSSLPRLYSGEDDRPCHCCED